MTEKKFLSPPSEQVLELPILKHFPKEAVSLNPSNWRKGEKGLNNIILLALLVAGGWAAWTYVLPPVLMAIGQLAGVAITIIGVLFLLMRSPVIYKVMRRVTRFFHQMVIRYAPFAELHEQREKMVNNKTTFKTAKVKIKQLRDNAQSESIQAEKDAKDFQTQVLSLREKAKKLRDQMTAMENQLGPQRAKETDEYVALQNEGMKVLSQAQRVEHQLKQAQSFVSKYGARANVMSKLDRKLSTVETAMDIKILDFDATIEMLEKEFEFARTARVATDAAKSALGFSHEWELEYALNVVQSTISLDLATTQENLGDIDTLTAQYSTDSDELYAKLDALADRITSGEDPIAQASRYANPNYTLSHEDRANSGGFGNIFN